LPGNVRVTSHVNVVKDTLQHTVRGVAVVLGNLRTHVTVTSLKQLIDQSTYNTSAWQTDRRTFRR